MLKFNNGKFKIIQIADTQDTQKTSPDTVALITAAVERENPDLVVFTGDQLKGYGVNFKFGDAKENVTTAITNLVKPVDKLGVPFAVTFGNHDTQCGVDKAGQLEIYNSFRNCINKSAYESLDGANLCLPVYSGDKAAFNVVVLDTPESGSLGNYTGGSKEQIEWTENVCEKLNAESGKAVPTMIFKHIPVYEMYDLLTPVPKGTKGAIQGNISHRDTYYILSDELKADGGYMKENIACAAQSNGQFDSWLSMGNVVAAYFGHDHINSFRGNLKGIDLGYTPGCGFNIYGPGLDRAVRVFEIDESGNYETRLVTFRDIFGNHMRAPVKGILYSYAPSSVDAVKPVLAKAGIALGAAAVIGAAAYAVRRTQRK